MTTPPPTGRYYVVTCASGVAVSVPRETLSEAELVRARNDQSCNNGPHRIVECVAMPRVRIVRVHAGYWGVEVNGLEVSSSGVKGAATKRARDLRRALRKGNDK